MSEQRYGTFTIPGTSLRLLFAALSEIVTELGASSKIFRMESRVVGGDIELIIYVQEE